MSKKKAQVDEPRRPARTDEIVRLTGKRTEDREDNRLYECVCTGEDPTRSNWVWLITLPPALQLQAEQRWPGARKDDENAALAC